MLWQNLNNKRIGIWGMGREGISVKKSINLYSSPKNIIEIGENNLSDIDSCDIIVKSPGVSLYRDEITRAKQKGICITSATNLFFANKNPRQKIIAITGTKGKSTTSALLAHTLQHLGVKTALGGNIGVPLLDLIQTPADIIVAELSSYQCADLTGTPDIGVLMNLYPEHLPWHKSHARYYADKINMIQKAGQAVLNKKDPRTHELVFVKSPVYFNQDIYEDGEWFYEKDTRLFSASSLALKGDHNRQNACAVLTIIKLLGMDLNRCQPAFQTFQALPHRLEMIGQVKDITFIDDSISTTPETAIAAMESFKGTPITLIMGGQDRGQDYHALADYVQAHHICTITLPDTGRRMDQLTDTYPADNMKQAVALALHHTPKGGIVLLSPAAPSYNLYQNFEQRGADFKRCVFE